MPAHPETLSVIRVVHDTLRAVIRDTVVRVAEPYHEPARVNWFFGRMYPADLIVATVALLNAGYTGYISFIQRARIRLSLGDHVGIVLNPGDVGRKLHLRCNFVNLAVKMGTVEHLEAVVRGPHGFSARFRWNLFYKYAEGGQEVQKVADVYPLAVAGRDSHLEFIEFDVVETPDGASPNWVTGRYTLTVEGWVNKRNRREKFNLRTVLHFSLPEGAEKIAKATFVQSHFLAFPVEEWQSK
jgi:hypothetical protein